MGIVVVGCGYWGGNHIKTLSSLGILAGVCDLSYEKMNKASEEYNVPYIEFEKLLNSNDYSKIVIATNAETHYDIAFRCLSHNKNILVEKPLALSSSEAMSLHKEAMSRNLVLMVGHLLNFHPAYIKVQDLIKQGVIGKILSIKSRRMSTGQIRVHENVLWSFAPHDIGMILGFDLGHWKVQAARGNTIVSDLEDEYFAALESQDGVKVDIHVSWIHPYKEHKLFIAGESGSIVFDDGLEWSKKVALYSHKLKPSLVKGSVEYIHVEEGMPLTRELLYFNDCSNNNSMPDISSGLHAVKVIEILEEIEKYGK